MAGLTPGWAVAFITDKALTHSILSSASPVRVHRKSQTAMFVTNLDYPLQRSRHGNCSTHDGLMLSLSLIHISEPTRPY